MTQRKPPLPPEPKRTRPLAQPKPRPTGLASEIMARCKIIRDDSEGKIDNATIAAELGLTKQEVSQYLTGSGGLPYGDRMVAWIIWGLRHDKNLLKDLK